MLITEFAEITMRPFEVVYEPDCSAPEGKWMAHFRMAEYKRSSNDSFLTSFSGYGETPEAAINNFIEEAKRGYKIIIFGAGSPNRKTFGMPELTFENQR